MRAAGKSRHTEEICLPVQNHGFDLVIEAIQGDVVCHELFHLQLVRDVHGGFKAAGFGNCKADQATAGANLESGGKGDMSVSCHVVVVFVASCWMKNRHKLAPTSEPFAVYRRGSAAYAWRGSFRPAKVALRIPSLNPRGASKARAGGHQSREPCR